jgi:hypothetical protein
LTLIRQFAQAIVASEVSHNQFTIRTDKPNVKVSWQVTGIRQDAYANAHRVQVEEDKPPQDQGHYLHPELFGAPPERAVGYHAACTNIVRAELELIIEVQTDEFWQDITASMLEDVSAEIV